MFASVGPFRGVLIGNGFSWAKKELEKIPLETTSPGLVTTVSRRKLGEEKL